MHHSIFTYECGLKRVDNFTCICMIGIATDIFEYDSDIVGYLRMEAFAMASATTACGQSTVKLSNTGAYG